MAGVWCESRASGRKAVHARRPTSSSVRPLLAEDDAYESERSAVTASQTAFRRRSWFAVSSTADTTSTGEVNHMRATLGPRAPALLRPAGREPRLTSGPTRPMRSCRRIAWEGGTRRRRGRPRACLQPWSGAADDALRHAPGGREWARTGRSRPGQWRRRAWAWSPRQRHHRAGAPARHDQHRRRPRWRRRHGDLRLTCEVRHVRGGGRGGLALRAVPRRLRVVGDRQHGYRRARRGPAARRTSRGPRNA